MKKKERLQLILSLINHHGEISVHELEQELNVSTMTIRRDLDTLDEQKMIKRIHGGAMSLTFGQTKQLDYSKRMEIHLSEKLAVAQAAAKQIQDNDIVFLGPGTTIELIVDFIQAKDIQIVTSSATVFERIKKLQQPFQIILTGGIFNDETGSFGGPLAYSVIEKLQFDKTFISVNGIRDGSVSNCNMEASELQHMALKNSTKRFIVADMHKFNKRAFFDFYTLQKEDFLVTNHELPDSTKKEYDKKIRFIFTKAHTSN